MKGSEFAATFGTKGFTAWEAAAFDLAKSGDGVVLWPWVDVTVTDGRDTVVVRAQSDVFSVGTPEDFLRLPLTPSRAQEIGNLAGYLLPTPYLVYAMWKAAPVKLSPTAMVPNKGANMGQFVEHNAVIESQRAGRKGLVAGAKKSVVVGNLWRPGKVLLFGWYRPEPDVFDDHKPMGTPGRQPTQPYSNVHGDFYFDYSHGIHFLHSMCLVNGKETPLVEVYQHPELSRLVSHEGVVRQPRYPAPNAPAAYRPAHIASYPTHPLVIQTTPGYAEAGLAKTVHDYEAKKGS